MPEQEVFKVAIQLGSFGILSYAVIWVLRVGWPEVRDTIKYLAEKHEATEKRTAEKLESTIVRQAEAAALALQALGDRHEKAVATLVDGQTRLVKSLDDNCRQERLQFAKLLASSMPMPAEE